MQNGGCTSNADDAAAAVENLFKAANIFCIDELAGRIFCPNFVRRNSHIYDSSWSSADYRYIAEDVCNLSKFRV